MRQNGHRGPFKTVNEPGVHPDAPRGGGGAGGFRYPRAPHPLGLPALRATPPPILLSATATDRALIAVQRALPKLLPDVRDEVKAMATPAGLALMATIVASNFTPAGPFVDAVAAGVGIGMMGLDAIEIGTDFYSFWEISTHASSDADLDRAADDFARAISKLAIDAPMVFFAIRGARGAQSESLAKTGASAVSKLDSLKAQVVAAAEDIVAKRKENITDPLVLEQQRMILRDPVQKLQGLIRAIAEELASQLRDELRTDSRPRVFFTEGLEDAAKKWMGEPGNGGKLTLNDTAAGKKLKEIDALLDGKHPLLFEGRVRYAEERKLAWERLSKELATGVEGEVIAFVRGERTTQGVEALESELPKMKLPRGEDNRKVSDNPRKVFWETELPELRNLRSNPKVTGIIFHVYDQSGVEIGPEIEIPRLNQGRK